MKIRHHTSEDDKWMGAGEFVAELQNQTLPVLAWRAGCVDPYLILNMDNNIIAANMQKGEVWNLTIMGQHLDSEYKWKLCDPHDSISLSNG